MADLSVEMCGLKFKNPIISASDDFGGDVRMAERALKQGIGGLVTKCIHKDIGSERWPRPYFFPLKRFGMPNAMLCQEMFSHIKYDKWIKTEGPKVIKKCKEYDARVIVNIAGKGAETDEDRESWQKVAKDQGAMGAEALELDIGGPHGVFGQPERIKVAAAMGVDPKKAAIVTKWVKEVVDIPVIPKMTPLAAIVDVGLAVQEACADAVSANNAVYGIFIDHETGSFYGTPACCGYLYRDFLPFSLAKVLELTTSLKIPVSGIGGIWNYADAVRYIMEGCPTVQISSSAYFKGARIYKEIIDGLNEYCDRKGYNSIEEFRGIVKERVKYIRDIPREKEIISPWISASPLMPKFYMGKCIECRACEKMCPYNAITVDKIKGNKIDDRYCMGCGMCVGVCPQNAIVLIERKTSEKIWDNKGVAKFKRWDEI
jgi:dihydroorotate dehydrogenase subfamily 1